MRMLGGPQGGNSIDYFDPKNGPKNGQKGKFAISICMNLFLLEGISVSNFKKRHKRWSEKAARVCWIATQMLSATAAAAAASSPEAGVCGGRQENGENGSVVVRDNIACREHCERAPLSNLDGGDQVSSSLN